MKSQSMIPPIRLAKRTQGPESFIRTIFEKIPEVKARREAQQLDPLINLCIGQPHLKPQPEVMKRLEKDVISAEQDYGYSPPEGRRETLDAIVRLYEYYYKHVRFSAEEVMATTGATQALSNAFNVLIEKGDEVLTFKPCYAGYELQVEGVGGKLSTVSSTPKEFRPDARALDKMLRENPRVKMVILNYPHNPTGVCLTEAEAKQLADVLEKYPHVVIVIDDVYLDLNYSSKHVTVLDVAPQLKNRCIVIHSGAKGLLGAPDMRIGMLSAHPALIQAMRKWQLANIAGVPLVTQRALVHAVNVMLENPTNEWLVSMRKEYQTNIETLLEALSVHGLRADNRPEGAFYLFLNAGYLIGKETSDKDILRNDLDIVNYFMHTAGVLTVPGSGFGMAAEAGYIRISCAMNKACLLRAAEKIGEAIKLLHEPVIELCAEPKRKTALVAGALALVRDGLFKQSGSVTGVAATSNCTL